ncbi:MAG: hypothetical protein V3U96_00870 [Paracoccaceae bacterium]
MRWLFKWLKRLLLTALLLVALLASPIAWIETACRPNGDAIAYDPIVTDPNWQRAESRSLMTYPEWHIVHAYDDYARVIRGGNPHEYGYLSSIGGFWSSLCALSKASGPHGGFSSSKATIYTIGVSFTAELAMKAAYEETLGRIATWVRGPDHSPLDDLSAGQAAEYARFLQQVPWYQWDFSSDIAALNAARTDSFRDRERAIALGLEFGAKAKYAGVIAAAVASVGVDQLTLRMIISDIERPALAALDGVQIIATHPQGIEIETPRYRVLTHILDELARDGASFVEVAGNDDIMLTAISDAPYPGALHSFKRQGYGDFRHLISLKVTDLADTLRSFDTGPITLEHIHDY